MYNPRQSNGNARRKAARRFAAMGAECALCHGARGAIDYTAPRDHLHPLSLAIDEIRPVARWQEFGYPSARACATDPQNWQATHWICNALAGDKRNKKGNRSKVNLASGGDRPSGTF